MHSYFEYAYANSSHKIEAMLEDMFASGDVVETEFPKIVRKKRSDGTPYWCIMLRMD